VVLRRVTRWPRLRSGRPHRVQRNASPRPLVQVKARPRFLRRSREAARPSWTAPPAGIRTVRPGQHSLRALPLRPWCAPPGRQPSPRHDGPACGARRTASSRLLATIAPRRGPRPAPSSRPPRRRRARRQRRCRPSSGRAAPSRRPPAANSHRNSEAEHRAAEDAALPSGGARRCCGRHPSRRSSA
jgi:hypothetical protein